ncbi:MAG TPA: HNH endonuclease signature motif containing protein [Pyrinomonadaceae bacterium]|nr:HNH endonuclease signature motif containing protein [Pyrinomonadaceae bacterium]
MPRKISSFLQIKVRKRAGYLCEYCHANERWQFVTFTIDHIIPTSEGGNDSLKNLALACFHCNRHKSNKQLIGDIQIFNPREMSWNEHFIWSKGALRILAKTKIGEATIEILQFNRERLLVIRADDLKINRHPPQGDEIEN